MPLIRRTVLAACVALLAAFSAQAQTKLRVGVEGNYPPFSKMGADGKLSGFDIDIAMAVCAQMKAECTLVQQEWDGMMPALNAMAISISKPESLPSAPILENGG